MIRESIKRSEIKLLLRCLRIKLSDESKHEVRSLLEQPLEWAFLKRTAEEHGVLPLLYLNFHRIFADLVPKPILRQLLREV